MYSRTLAIEGSEFGLLPCSAVVIAVNEAAGLAVNATVTESDSCDSQQMALFQLDNAYFRVTVVTGRPRPWPCDPRTCPPSSENTARCCGGKYCSLEGADVSKTSVSIGSRSGVHKRSVRKVQRYTLARRRHRHIEPARPRYGRGRRSRTGSWPCLWGAAARRPGAASRPPTCDGPYHR